MIRPRSGYGAWQAGWLAAGILGFCSTTAAVTYTTKGGETREIELDEGHRVHLNTKTRLEWLGDAGERRVVLHEGEAYFDFKPDAAPPLHIELRHSGIEAAGGRFNVYLKENGEVVVTVLEGMVLIEGHEPKAWRRDLRANQRIAYRGARLTRDVHEAIDASDAVKWREGTLGIRDRPLPEVLRELQRYTERRIVSRDWRLKRIRIGGVVSTRDVRAALARLEKLAPITVTEKGEALIVDYRP